jgi:hypothetical protein
VPGNAADKRRIRRLALAATVWAAALLSGAAVLGAVVPRRGCASSPGGTVCVEHVRLPAAETAGPATHVDDTFSRVATTLAGRKATVVCWSESDWADEGEEWAENWPRLGPLGPWRAFTEPRAPWTINLSPAICAELTKLARARRPAWADDHREAFAWSIGALAHEAVHATGNHSEVKATCYGTQRIRVAARELGRSRREGEYLTALYWKHWYPWFDLRHRSSECRNGGRLDLRPGTNVWP